MFLSVLGSIVSLFFLTSLRFLLERKKEDSCSLTLRKMAPIKSKAWKYFIKEKNNLVVCNFCKKKLKFSNNTSNMFQHLKLKHAAEVDKFKVR